jgi:hypothetical protein
VSDQDPRAVAILAAIQAELPAGVTAYEADGVPGSAGGPGGTLPSRYVTIELSRRWHPEKRGDADMIPGFALTTHYRAPNIAGIGGCRDLRKAVTAALENRAYSLLSGDTIGPFSFEFDGGMNYVAEGWSGFDTWRA